MQKNISLNNIFLLAHAHTCVCDGICTPAPCTLMHHPTLYLAEDYITRRVPSRNASCWLTRRIV